METFVDYENLLSRAACGLFECEPDGTLSYANQAYADLTGQAIPDLIGKRSFLSLLDPNTPEVGMGGPQSWLKALAADRHFEQECVYQCGDRSRRTVLQAISPLRQNGRRRYVGVTMDVSSRAAESRNAWYASHHDASTRLPNLFLFEERLALLLRRRPVAVMSLGLDDIGTLPRASGLPEWENAVLAVADRLRTFSGYDGVVSHLGAGEFLMVLDGGEPAVPTAQAMLKRVSEPLQVSGRMAYPRASAGLYEHQGGGDTACAHDLIRRAHLALSHARQGGGNSLRVFEPKMESALSDRWALASDLAAAVNAHSLYLDYQPEFDLMDGRMRVAEALVRWRHPVRGQVSPAEFIPVAETAGLMEVLGSWVLETACRFARMLQTRYEDPPSVAVNVSPVQFRRPDFADEVVDVLVRTELPPQLLELEVTEGVLMEGGKEIEATLQRLHAMGVSLVLDDFGTGFSSLGYLARYPVDRLKIDQSFVRKLPDDARSLAIVTAVIGMARALKIEVTAEGIEHEAQAEVLRGLGCTLGQGFGLSRPMAERALVNMLKPRFG
ncbi:signalling protein [Bordetella ansorpii]|uniref:Signalling protein n=1 Tax=Bordetella ansorpii TaxID=288768 RepID=A0A157RRF4_9BORD|nr:signalling protein [Bordetella ansorpii]